MTERAPHPVVLLAALAAIAGACGSPPRPDEVTAAGRGVTDVRPAEAVAVTEDSQAERIPLGPLRVGALDPSILLPADPASDDVLARVGTIELRKSHVFDRLLDSNRRMARNLVDLLIMDAVIAEQAQHHGITVDSAAIDALIAREERLLRDRVEIDWGGRKSFDDYVASQFDLSVDDYRRFLRIELARERYRSYVIRFLALLEDRVEVRIVVNRDKATVEDVARSVRDGADFATLAFRHSEDETRGDGGRMPPFSRAFDHPIAKSAFELEGGELSDVFEIQVQGAPHWCLVYCLQRVPGRPGVTFDKVRRELIEGLEARALTPFEQKSFALRWCRDTERLPSERPPR